MALEFSWQLPLCDTDGTTPWAHRPEQWIQLAQAVEYAGLDGLWVPGGAQCADSLGVAATLCAHTRRVHLTVSVPPEVMLPAALAATVQSLQSISANRVRLQDEYDTYVLIADVQALTDNLHLSLELERQRMLALRAQLEPHFIFNALNAISALVRTSDGDLALNGINRLSDLLRYALTASGRDWVSVGEELAFVGDYLALQRLRYRARLQVQMDIGDVHGGECPPLLLQPLIENALRHDLDCHEGDSDIRIHMQRDGAQLHIRISNPVTADASPNPGLGMGLANTRARLQLAYGGEASLDSALRDGRYEVAIRMPLYVKE